MQHLHDKGWTTEEVARVKVTFQKLDKMRTNKHRIIDLSIFFLLLLFTAGVHASFAILMIPLFLFFPVGFFGVILIFGGFTFGLLFAHLTKDIRKGHGTFMAVSSLIALVFFGLIFKGANEVELALGSPLRDSFLFAALYVLSFMMPFTFIHTRRRQWN